MKRLSEKQAAACENAINPRCRCRCGGALHGAKRGAKEYGDALPPREFFEELPPDDAHRITSAEEVAERKTIAADILKLRRVLKKLEHDRDRLLELGDTKPGARLEEDIKHVRARIEWHRARAHAT